MHREFSAAKFSAIESLIARGGFKRVNMSQRFMHSLFELQVQSQQDAIAVIFNDSSLTYGELNARANQLARYLQQHGVGPETLVGICFERSLEMPVALLGILKAGGAFVPLDPSYPAERLAFMLRDAQPTLLLTQEHLVPTLPASSPAQFCLDQSWPVIANQPCENLPFSGDDHTLAYVIYTSGSTGQPKGVQIEQAGLYHLALAQRFIFSVQPQHRIIQFASLSFDASVFEFCMALTAGATLCLGTRDSLLPGLDLQQFLQRYAITHATLPPSVLTFLPIEQLAELEILISAGEALSRDLVALLSPIVSLYNAYGPTEATVWATGTFCSVQGLDQRPSIGTAIQNAETYILDAHFQPVPTDVAGELYLGGVGISRGYLRRPELTAERFIPHPFASTPGERIYKTGDLVRSREDGMLEFLGRLDQQIKIRGFRIEPDEIENVLNAHRAIQRSLVMAREDRAGERRLTAYIVLKEGPYPAREELREYLQTQLPNYMLPSFFVFIQAFPLMSNGKIDRQALLKLESTDAIAGTAQNQTHSQTEKILTELWMDFLKLSQVAIHDTFFVIGGDSLIATQMVARIRDLFQVDISLRTFFEKPTIAKLAAEIEKAQGTKERRQLSLIEKRENNESLPLSFTQQRLWILDQLVSIRPAYIIPLALHLRGILQTEALYHSLNAIIQRHEILRTTFPDNVGQPFQRIIPHQTVAPLLVDLRDLTESRRESQVRRILAQEIQQPFDLAHDHLLRAMLFQLENEEYILLFTMHHLIVDDWSIDIFLRELTVLYKCFVEYKEPSLPELALQYADFALWQQTQLQEDIVTGQFTYWQQQLQNLPSALDLPIAHTRPSIQTIQGASQSFHISQKNFQDLRKLSSDMHVTLFTTLLAAFCVLLYRYSNQNDIIIGIPVANRSRTELESLIGFFANTLVIRTFPENWISFREFLRQAQDVLLEAYTHQDLPFERLVELLQPQRTLSYNPLFQVMFLFQNSSQAFNALDMPHLQVRRIDVQNETVQCDLQLEITETPQRLEGRFRFNTDLFEASTISYMVRHFQILLEAIATDPDCTLAHLPLLTVEEHDTLRLWNATQASYPSHQYIHHFIEAQIEQTPDAIALFFEDTSLTYRELNRRSNQLAHYLCSLGVGPEVPVSIYMERSLEMVIGLLGIIKAGGVYIPLDPVYPEERLRFMMTEIGASVILTQKKLRASLPEITATIVSLDDSWSALAAYDEANPVIAIEPDNLFYIIYTSGSTGRPKGAMNTHRGVCNRLLWMQDTYHLLPSDRVLQKTPYSFDVSGWEFFWPLLSGACLVIAPPGSHRDSQALFHIITQQSITILHFVPSMLEEYLSTRGIEECTSLRHVFCSGEVLPASVQQQFFACLPAKLHNLYGPTEAAIDATFWECERNSELSYVPIGRPIANMQAYVLDSQYQIVPTGLPGELYLAGSGLARGYFSQPDRTAERFLPNPFSEEAGSRLYKTGDLACYQADGSIKYLGRTDYQVKLRGFRIELGEIEAVLLEHPLVQKCIVVAKGHQSALLSLVAYVTITKISSNWLEELRSFLKKRLPEYMVPTYFVALDTFPLTRSGKVDRLALPEPSPALMKKNEGTALSLTYLEQSLVNLWQEVLQLDHVGTHDNFFDLGGHSLLVIRVQRELQKRLNLHISVADLFTYPTIGALATYLSPQLPLPDILSQVTHSNLLRGRQEERTEPSRAIAIIGMAGRFPGAQNIDAFWKNLQAGVESIVFFTDEELIAAGVDPADLQSPNYIKAHATLANVDQFDASFFGYSPREAELMDPQQRLFLECAWEALEYAGYSGETHQESIGIYAGLSTSGYLISNLLANSQIAHLTDKFQIMMGNEKDYFATRIAYKLNLNGPSVSIQTACSTSLVAVHLACQSLLREECNIALAGGCSISIPQKVGYWYQEGGIASPDGHCRAFDALAQGSIGGDGLGIVVLKRLDDALHDGDTIHAIIKGSAINNDGAAKVSYTAPSVHGQTQVIREAIKQAGIQADTIRYIETHGTATPLGDLIEVSALNQSYGAIVNQKASCALGSVKTNIGHLDAAAGIAGLIKAILTLKYHQIPPSLHFETPNPRIDFASGPFYVNQILTPWPATNTPRRAAVSSFGIGGTNAHLILEEAPTSVPRAITETDVQADSWQLLTLSAKTASALETMTDNLFRYLQEHPELALDDVAYTLQVGRQAFEHRRIIACQHLGDAIQTLATRDSACCFTMRRKDHTVPVAWLFPGQGTQYVSMTAELYQHEPVFSECFDRCAEILLPRLGIDLRTLLYPSARVISDKVDLLDQTWLTQPLLFAVEYALAQLWLSWGIIPQAMIGHSLGEYVVACLARVFSLEEALILVADRGNLMQQMAEGAMLAAALAEEEIPEFLDEQISLAAINAPRECVVAGPVNAIDILAQRLLQQKIPCQRLKTSRAFHSRMLEPMLEAFTSRMQQVTLRTPSIPYISNLTGTWITPEQATDPLYWVQHTRECVHFSQGLRTLLQDSSLVLLEVGPGQSLQSLVRRNNTQDKPLALSTLPSAHMAESESELATLLTTLGRLWLCGASVNWPAFQAHKPRRRIPLPAYPFEHQRYWIEPSSAPSLARDTERDQIVGNKKSALADWFYVPTWKLSPPATNDADEPLVRALSCWLVFSNSGKIAHDCVQSFRKIGHKVIEVIVGERFNKISNELYELNPLVRTDYDALLRELQFAMHVWPQNIIHFWSVTPHSAAELSLSQSARFAPMQERGFYSLLYLTQAIDETKRDSSLHITVVSNYTCAVAGYEAVWLEKTTIGGICKIIPQEYPFITCSSIDLMLAHPGSWQEQRQSEQIIKELLGESKDHTIAYRGNQRWIQAYDPIRLEEISEQDTLIRNGGTYLIIGGLGQIGLTIAEYLVRQHQARLILVGHTPVPERAQWTHWLLTHEENEKTSQKIKALRSLEQLGANMLWMDAEASNEEQMREVLRQAEEHFGALHGVFYAAGVNQEQSFCTIHDTDQKIYNLHAQIKIHGAFVLERLLQGKDLDFCLLSSSLSTVLGGLGFAAYASANCVLDAIAYQQSLVSPTRWISVNWDGWRFDNKPQKKTLMETMASLALTPEEGIEALKRILSKNCTPQVIVSTSDLHARIAQWVEYPRLQANSLSQPEQEVTSHSRPDLQNTYIAPRNDIEQIIADIWQDLLGIEAVGIHDNFLDLGGHSLLATRVLTRLQEDLQIELSLRSFLETLTIAELAEHIEQQFTAQIGNEKAAQLLSEIDALTDEELDTFLSQE
jgi:amino acid adenylation domain-containing protein